MNSYYQDVLGDEYWINPNGSVSASISVLGMETVLGNLKTAVSMGVSPMG